MSKQEKLLAEKTVGLKPSGIRRFFDLVSEMKDAISLGVGEPDFDTPWHIRDEGIYSLEKGRTFYTSNSGLKELRMEIAAYMKRTQGITYDPIKEILITVGGSEAIDLMFRAMINEGDEVLIPQPSYVSYEPCTILADGKPVVIPLKNENEFRLKPEELRAAITPRSKILVLPYPNNPTGAVMEKEDLEAIADIIIENDLYVLSDEIYSGKIFPQITDENLAGHITIPFLSPLCSRFKTCEEATNMRKSFNVKILSSFVASASSDSYVRLLLHPQDASYYPFNLKTIRRDLQNSIVENHCIGNEN